MSIKSKVAALTLAAFTVTASVAATTQAQAGPKHHHHYRHSHVGWGVGAGLLGAAVVGSAIAASDPYYYRQPRCTWVAQYDAFGNYMGRVRSCY